MKKHKFNWVDGLILAVVVLLIAGTAVKFLVKDNTSVKKEQADFQYQILIHGVRDITVNALQVGDTVYDNEGKGAVGVINNIEVTDAPCIISRSDGTLVEGTMEDRYDVVLTLDAQGEPTDQSYKIGTYKIKVNQYSTYFTKYSIWSGRIMSIG